MNKIKIDIVLPTEAHRKVRASKIVPFPFLEMGVPKRKNVLFSAQF